MPSTEIDEIFASKPRLSQVEIISSPKHKGKAKASLGSSEDTSVSGKKRKKYKIKSTINEDNSKPSLPGDLTSIKRKRAEPETIIDSSAPSQTAKKKKTSRVDVEEPSNQIAKRKTTRHDDFQKFRDSRGTGPRKKTEEGFSIYKEDELGIGDRGGDTSLCPFDCDCCF